MSGINGIGSANYIRANAVHGRTAHAHRARAAAMAHGAAMHSARPGRPGTAQPAFHTSFPRP
jgi:hypothetical protein